MLCYAIQALSKVMFGEYSKRLCDALRRVSGFKKYTFCVDTIFVQQRAFALNDL